MSVATVKDRLAAICALNTDIKKTYPYVPGALPAAHLPALIVFTRDATYAPQAATVWLETRRYDLALVVMSEAQGADGDPETISEPFFEWFRETFTARPGLYLASNADALENVQEAHLIQDSGVVAIEVGGILFGGITFSVSVEELFSVQPGS